MGRFQKQEWFTVRAARWRVMTKKFDNIKKCVIKITFDLGHLLTESFRIKYFLVSWPAVSDLVKVKNNGLT